MKRALILLLLAACGGLDPDINSSHPYERYLGLLELEKAGKKNAAQVASFLNDPDPLVRKGAVDVLNRSKCMEFEPQVWKLVTDTDALVRESVIEFEKTARTSARLTDILSIALTDTSSTVRIRSLEFARLFSVEARDQVVETFLKCYESDDPAVSFAAHTHLLEITGRKDAEWRTANWKELVTQQK